jgi:hypothetical protein
MPRTKDPVAELAAHRKKEAAFKDKAKLLEEQAAAHLGRKLMDRGLHAVDAKTMDDVLDRIAKLGADETLRRLVTATAEVPPTLLSRTEGEEAKKEPSA